MARAWRANTMSGHLGAALVAGYCFADGHRDLDPRVRSGIAGELDRITAGEETWFDSDAVGITVAQLFEPFPDAPVHPELVDSIADALSGNIDALRQSGHNVIFCAIAIRALRDYPQLATSYVVNGICKLVEGFNGEHPGRLYFGEEHGWVRGDEVPPSADDMPLYEDEQAMVQAVAGQLIDTSSERRQGVGGLWHIINHTAALIDLSRLGYGDLARRGYAAHQHHLELWGALPNLADELGPMVRAEHDPRTPEYWTTEPLRRDRALLTHRIKTLYGFHVLAGLIDDEARREAAEQAFLYLMA